MKLGHNGNNTQPPPKSHTTKFPRNLYAPLDLIQTGSIW